jgi:WD40 repeat protein
MTEGGVVHKQLAEHDQAIVGLCVSSDGKRLAAAGFENRMGLYDTATGEQIEKLACPCRDMRTVVFSPDGKLLAGAGRNGRIRIWNMEDATVLRNIEKAHTQRVRALAFSPDGLHLASAGEDRATRVWSVATGQKQSELKAPTAKILAMCYLADDRLATAGSDNAIRIWGLTSGQQLNVLQGHTGSVAALAYRDGTIVSGSFDTTVRLWQLDGQSVASGGRKSPESARRE